MDEVTQKELDYYHMQTVMDEITLKFQCDRVRIMAMSTGEKDVPQYFDL